MSLTNTPAKLIHAGVDASSVGPGVDPAAANTPSPDSDAAEAVAAMLQETGADRASIEGPQSGLTLPKEGEPAPTPASAAAPTDKPATPDKPAEGEPATPAAAAPAADEADLDLNLTAEDLAEIEKNPLAKKAYKVMVRGLNKKMQELAGLRKGAEQDLDIIGQVRKNPVAGLQALAAVLNIPIQIGSAGGNGAAPAAAPAAPLDPLAEATAELEKVLTPDGAKAMMPALVKLIEAVTGKELTPIKADLDTARRTEVMTQLDRALVNYGRAVETRGDDWNKEIETAMSELVGKIRPAPGTTLQEFLDVLYDRATGERSRAAMKTRQLTRLRAAASATEPVISARPAPATEKQITADMPEDEATSLAVQQTLKEMGLR